MLKRHEVGDLNFNIIMEDLDKKNNEKEVVLEPEVVKKKPFIKREGSNNSGEFQKNKRRNTRTKQRVKQEFDQKILDIRRVTRVAAGGRRFTFSVSMVIGDKKGRVGVGIGKAGDTSMAIDKAIKNAKKNMIEVKRTKENSIAHDLKKKYNSAKIMMMPAKGRGVIAGSAVKDVIELAGLTDINAKILSGSKNKLNIARATVSALEDLKN